MPLKKTLLFCALISINFAFSQNISVKSFKKLDNDLEARIHPVQFDGEETALIKIVTTVKNLKFESGSLGIAKAVEKTGEVWVYVPYGARFLTIKHNGLGVLRNYEYSVGKLQKATTYELVLATAKITTIVEEKLPQFGSIDSKPQGADVYVDGLRIGTTPTKSFSLLEGDHTISIRKVLYADLEDRFTVTADKKFSEQYVLKPKFGTIIVESLPEDGASITLDGKQLEETTPASISFIKSGTHTLRIGKDLFDIKQQEFTLTDGETKTLRLALQPLFGTLSITATPQATIYIDNQERGVGRWSGRLLKGIHGISIQKPNYHTQNKTHEVVLGSKESLSFSVLPKTGTLKIESSPENASVYVDGVLQGTSPMYVRELMVGSHSMALQKKGYTKVTKTISIYENQTTETNETLTKEAAHSYTGDLISVAGGTFKMGSSSGKSREKPVHSVTVASFKMSKYEITNAQYAVFLNAKGNQKEGGFLWLDIDDKDCKIEKSGTKYRAKSGKENHPVVLVSWYGARAYCKWVGGRLPTEAEWEFAARGGTKSRGYEYAGSNSVQDVAWYVDNSGSRTHIVGTKKANELGLYDMSGNVWEWTNDWYGAYSSNSQSNPKGPSSGSRRVIRGGGWGSGSFCRVAFRISYGPTLTYDDMGFRPVFVP